MIGRGDLWRWRSIIPVAIAFGVVVEAAWFNLPRSARDFTLLLPCILPFVSYRRIGGWRRSCLYGAVAGLSVGVTRQVWLSNLGRLFSSPWRWLEAMAETLFPILVLAFGCLVAWLAGRLVFGRLIIVDSAAACRSCGYNLTGNVSGICPECGAPVGES